MSKSFKKEATKSKAQKEADKRNQERTSRNILNNARKYASVKDIEDDLNEDD